MSLTNQQKENSEKPLHGSRITNSVRHSPVKPPLKLQKPAFQKRVFFAVLAVIAMCFGSVMVIFPIIYIVRELSIGVMPWPLVGFAFLSGTFGTFMIWLGARCGVWILPYQFTVNLSEKICGYAWKDSWINKVNLSEIAALVTAPAHARRVWPWAIYARFERDRGLKAILNSHDSFSTEEMAFEHSFLVCAEIAEYLGVPVEFGDWSPQILSEHNHHGKQDIADNADTFRA